MRNIVSVSLILLCGITGHTRELSLQQALDQAEAHSFSRQAGEAMTAAVGRSLQAVRAERLPTLSIISAATYVDDVPSLDFSIPGGSGISRDFGSNESYQTDLNLSWPLYTGGRVSSAIDIAAANYHHRQATEAVDRNSRYFRTRLHYFGLYQAVELHKVALSSLRRTEIIQADVESRYQAGAADSVDLLEARLAHTRASFAVKDAEVNVRLHEIRLLVLLGLSRDEHLQLTDSLNDPPSVSEISGASLYRPEIEAAEAVVNLNRARLKLGKAEYFPSLSVFAGYSYGKPNIDPFHDEWNDNVSLGARLNWAFNLGDRTGAQKKTARYNLDAAVSNRARTVELVELDARLALEKLNLAYERFVSAEDEYQISLQNHRLAQQRHREGDLSANRLLEIETNLTQAQSALAAARVGFYIAQSEHYYAIGSEELRKGL